jgi:DNA-binding XRE family transcriptional regulator
MGITKIKPVLRLKALRVEHQFTQADMARKINISKNDYAKKENGKKYFDFEDCLEISKVFNKPLKEIFDGYFDGFLS